MDIPRPEGGDVDIGIGIFKACWVLTGVVALVLIFRFVVKAWVYWALPKVSSPERIWGLEDLIFLFASSYSNEQYITSLQRKPWPGKALLLPIERGKKSVNEVGFRITASWQVHRIISYLRGPILIVVTAVAASMISRTGMMWFLYQCFGINNTKAKRILIVCAIIQIIVNSFTILQIVLQCGPNPYRLVDRTKYFHYMWDPLPTDGSVTCQDPSVQATVGFVQGGFNTIIDFSLAYVSAFELWQILFRSSTHHNTSFIARFRELDRTTKSRRLWQTATLSGPLVLSGVASIVKTYLLKALGDRLDFTYNIPSFVLWVKIENYCILIATCAPVARLFIRIFIDSRRGIGPYGSHGRSNTAGRGQAGTAATKSKNESNLASSQTHYGTHDGSFNRLGSDLELASVGSEDRIIRRASREEIKGIQVKSDVVIRVDDDSTLDDGRVPRTAAGRNPKGWSSANVNSKPSVSPYLLSTENATVANADIGPTSHSNFGLPLQEQS
ncbi:hypothetical protein V494_06880 [Pseudogymnoascus sp. VKM F-4513 (FW-928)]|nr:hypothetical protein V494_06880 [Pseudogymnoascus sp. VKM F-4513 (FW-928)]